jgi:hypothetical protein
MMKAKWLLSLGIVALAGCTDTIDSICREYRNTDNEVIDALMMITTEEKAAEMNTRVFKGLKERYKRIDDKYKAWEINQETNLELVKQILTSDGMHLYRAELAKNRKRFALEMQRLSKLRSQYLEDAEDGDLKRVAPTLEVMGNEAHALGPFAEQLSGPHLEKKIYQWMAAVDAPEDRPAPLPRGVTKEKLKEYVTKHRDRQAEFDRRQGIE